MSNAVLLEERPVKNWRCPSCGHTDRAALPLRGTRMHHCPELNGFAVPLIEVKHLDDRADGQHTVSLRDDYVGKEDVQYFGSKPIMSINTWRGDGSNDCTVFAPCAHPEVQVSPPVGYDWHDPALRELALAGQDTYMAFGTNSRCFAVFLLDTLTQVASHIMDLGTDTFYCALFGNTGTPDATVAVANSEYAAGQWVVGNEITSAGQWAAGGVTMGVPTCAQATSVVTFGGSQANTSSSAGATLTAVYGCLVYDHTLATHDGLCFLAFGGSNTVTSGTFSVVYNASGVATFTV